MKTTASVAAGNPAVVQRRYTLQSTIYMAAYVAVNLAAITGAFDEVKGHASAWILALAVAAPVAAHMRALLVMMRDSDEYLRAVAARRFVTGAGIAIALFSGWGFAEVYAAAPHAPGFLIYPLFWFGYCVSLPFADRAAR